MSVEKAIEKINAEMQKKPGDPYLEIIGHYIIDRCYKEETAQRVATEGKTLSGAMDAVMAAAQKKIKGQMAMLRDRDIFDAVDKYFGLSKDRTARMDSCRAVCGGVEDMREAPAAPPPSPVKGKLIELSLEDFI